MSKQFPPFVFSSPLLSPLCSPIRCFNEEIRLPQEINRAIFNKLLQVERITFKDWTRIHTEIGIEFGTEYDAYMLSPLDLRSYFKSMLIKQIRHSVYGLNQQSENFKKLLYPFLLKVNRIDVKFKCEGPVPPVPESQILVQQALILYKLTMMKNRFNIDVYNTLRNVRGKSFEIHVENPEFGLKSKQKRKLCGTSQGQISRVAVNQAGSIDAPPVVTNEEGDPTDISITEPPLPETPDSPLATSFVQDEELPTASPAVEAEEMSSTQAPAEFSIGNRILPPRMETNEIVNQTDISGNNETKMEYIRYFIQEYANMPLETHALYCKTDQLFPEIENENLPMTYPEWYKKNNNL